MSLAATKQTAWELLPTDWQMVCQRLNLPRFRANQIVTALYQNFATGWQDVTTLSVETRAALAECIEFTPLELVETQGAADGVRKLLLKCHDGELIESVLIPSKGRLTQCISTQVGCNFKCAFCASGQAGCRRNLSAGEIVAQVMAACALLREAQALSGISGKELPRPGNVVVMGMGEPFDNYDNLLRALRILNEQRGLNIGARHITISTCGVVPGIERLSGEGVQFELSVSLHAPDDELRSRLMPVNQRWPLRELLAACRAYFEKSGRLVTFEYTLIRNVNDHPSHARALIKLLSTMPCKVNLIPLSPVAGFSGERPAERVCLSFLDELLRAKIPTTMRQSRGRDVNAACGQLRLRHTAPKLSHHGN